MVGLGWGLLIQARGLSGFRRDDGGDGRSPLERAQCPDEEGTAQAGDRQRHHQNKCESLEPDRHGSTARPRHTPTVHHATDQRRWSTSAQRYDDGGAWRGQRLGRDRCHDRGEETVRESHRGHFKSQLELPSEGDRGPVAVRGSNERPNEALISLALRRYGAGAEPSHLPTLACATKGNAESDTGQPRAKWAFTSPAG